MTFDTDWLVVGSGFGGSVSALRLAEAGNRVIVVEAGRAFEDGDFAKTTSDMRRYFFAPLLGLRGIMRMSLFRDLFLVTGAGVGGGSLTYAATLYRARTKFYEAPEWRGMADWEQELAPCYDTAEKMLGVVGYDRDTQADVLLREFADQRGAGDSFQRASVGIYFGEPGASTTDPFFGGAGPPRTGCTRCGGCMVGCRIGAKNTLPKNYLWFARQSGARILADRNVIDIRPRGAADGSDGYVITHERTGAWVRRDRQTLTARGVVVAAGALGTVRLLFRCKLSGALPDVSDRLGFKVRTNSESVVAVTARNDVRNFADGVAITSSVFTDADTHIEPITYGRGANSMSALFNVLTERGSRRTRPLFFMAHVVRHPLTVLRGLYNSRFSTRTMFLLVMQTLDGAMRIKPRGRLPSGFVVLTTEQDPVMPNPDYIPVAYEAARWIADRIGGTPKAVVTEAALRIPTTAHILGGAVISNAPDQGVVDSDHRVHGYQNLLVCDGSVFPANPGVNPSLTITALAERAMSRLTGQSAHR